MDLNEKRAAYRDAGVGEIWFVDFDERKLVVDRKGEEGYTTESVTAQKMTSTVLAGFWVHAAWLWAEPLPNIISYLQEMLAGAETGSC